MRMEADMNSVTSLIEENGKLQAELNATRTALQVSQSEVMLCLYLFFYFSTLDIGRLVERPSP